MSLSNQSKNLLRRIDEAKAQIDEARPLSASILQRLRNQIILEWTYNSNAIEGNTLTLRETLLILQEGLTIGGKSLQEHLEVINHKEAIDFVELLAKKKHRIKERNIKDIHALILKKIDPKYAGKYRDIQVRITGSTHTPPDALQVPFLMKDFSQKYLSKKFNHPVEKAALVHFHLVDIHPFVDGNGRTARLLMNLVLMKHGFPPAVILKNDRKKYYDALELAHKRKTESFIFFIGRSLERNLGLYLEVLPKSRNKLITFSEAEREFSISKHYLGVMARRGVIPAFKLKRNWVISKKTLKEYLSKQKVKRSRKKK